MHILVIDRSKVACSEMVKYLSAIGHSAIAVTRVEDAVDTLNASLAWESQFDAIVLTADYARKTPILWFLKYLNNRSNELGVIPTLLQSEEDVYDAEGDKTALSTLSERQFPFVWYHTMDLKKLRYFGTFFKELEKRQRKGPTR